MRMKPGPRPATGLMYDAYNRIFSRCGLSFKVVEADSGPIGGSFSHEFMVLADTGEDLLASCTSCDYAANLEKAEVALEPGSPEPPVGGAPEAVPTPNVRTVEEVAAFLKVTPADIVKTLIYETEEGPVAVLIRGRPRSQRSEGEEPAGGHRPDPGGAHPGPGVDRG